MLTWERIRQLRALIVRAAQSLADDDAYYCPEFFAPWKANTQYKLGDRIQYGGKLYKVVQAHTSQADWTPDITPALYTEVPEPGTIPEWRQPTGAQDAYMIGDKVRHNEKVWESIMDYNVYEPGVFGWDEVT